MYWTAVVNRNVVKIVELPWGRVPWRVRDSSRQGFVVCENVERKAVYGRVEMFDKNAKEK